MTRRTFLLNLEKFCLAYGIQGVLSPSSFASSAPTRLVNFVVKYTGGCTDELGIGQWTTSGVLSPLSAFQSNMAFPLGLSAAFNAPMNSHAAPQICSLSGSMTGFVLRETEYPTGNLLNYSTGGGKSMDVLIGEKLKVDHGAQLPYLLMANADIIHAEHSTSTTSSWGGGGELLHSIKTVEGLRAEIESRASCEKFEKPSFVSRMKALESIKLNQKIFSSNYLIDRTRFLEIEENLKATFEKTQQSIANIDKRGRVACGSFQKRPEFSNTESDRNGFKSKMDQMYDLGIIALRDNITRVLTYNLWLSEAHETSHYTQSGTIEPYYNVSRFYQESIASFVSKLSANNLFTDTLIFCNAGSSIQNDLHNYENLSTYVINGGVQGLRGTAGEKKPVGSLHLDIMHKFGIQLSEYGGSDHKHGVARKGNYL